jgi:cytochrome c-type biogenesis protein CcmH/NrfG
MKIKTLITACVLLCSSATAMAGLDDDILALQQRWASAKYTLSGADQEKSFAALTTDARKVVADNPDRAEPLVWLAIILSSDAGASGGISALGKVKEARKLLEQAEQIDAEVLEGSVYTSLGSLYYQVPGWPIGFGNDAKAESYLRKALAINPDGIDPNFFLGDFLLEEGKPAQAIQYLEKAQAAPARPQRPLADKGRQEEIARKLQEARSKL